jgi:ribose 5-phosphate isomerase B
MKIAVGSDHAGLQLKNELKSYLSGKGHILNDCGTHSADSCDYPDYAVPVCECIASGGAELGLLVCGTGIGMSMTANKMPGIRAAVVTDPFCAEATRRHNDANVICLGERVVGAGLAISILDAFFSVEYEGGRHARRVGKMMDAGQGAGG